jgi:hypothetical protein
MATKDSNNFVTFDHQTHGSCAATEGDTRLQAGHRDMEERARLLNHLFLC